MFRRRAGVPDTAPISPRLTIPTSTLSHARRRWRGRVAMGRGDDPANYHQPPTETLRFRRRFFATWLPSRVQ